MVSCRRDVFAAGFARWTKNHPEGRTMPVVPREKRQADVSIDDDCLLGDSIGTFRSNSCPSDEFVRRLCEWSFWRVFSLLPSQKTRGRRNKHEKKRTTMITTSCEHLGVLDKKDTKLLRLPFAHPTLTQLLKTNLLVKRYGWRSPVSNAERVTRMPHKTSVSQVLLSCQQESVSCVESHNVLVDSMVFIEP